MRNSLVCFASKLKFISYCETENWYGHLLFHYYVILPFKIYWYNQEVEHDLLKIELFLKAKLVLKHIKIRPSEKYNSHLLVIQAVCAHWAFPTAKRAKQGGAS